MKKPLLFAVILFTAQFSQAQWETDVRLTNNTSASNTAYTSGQHAIATSGDTVHVVWTDNRDGNGEIYYKRSTDGGVTWGADTRLTNEPATSFSATIAVSGSIVHIAWIDFRDYWLENWGEIYYKRSPNGGNSWGPDTRLSFYEGYSYHPSLAVSGESLHVVWYEQYEDMWEILYKHSINGGITWEEDTRLTEDPDYSSWPSISVSGTILHVTWHDRRDGNREIYYKRSADDGESWSEDLRLTYNDSSSFASSVAVSGSDVHVVWEDNRNLNNEIYYKHSSDGGLTWEADTRLTNNSYESIESNLAVSDSGLFLVFTDTRNGNKEIYYKHSSNGGISWGPDIRLTNNSSVSNRAYISSSRCQLNIVWTDERDGNMEIYFKRDPAGWDALIADFIANTTVTCPNEPVQFTDLSTCDPLQWEWTFPGGTPGTSDQQYPQITYEMPGVYDVTLYVSHGDLNDQITRINYITVLPESLTAPSTPAGPVELCQNAPNSQYSTSGSPDATEYIWQILPAEAVTISFGSDNTIIINWSDDYTGEASIEVKAANMCAESNFSPPLTVTLLPSPVISIVSGGGPYCFGTNGSTIELSSSQENHTYELYLNNEPTGSTMQGNGSMITFPNITDTGTYTMLATENSTLCSNWMEGAVDVSLINIPEIPPIPKGPAFVDLYFTEVTEYLLEGSMESACYEWLLDPAGAGTITLQDTASIEITWNPEFSGITHLSVRGTNECGSSDWSESLAITVANTIGWNEINKNIAVHIYPNPGNGSFIVDIQSKNEGSVTLRLISTRGEVIFEKQNIDLTGINYNVMVTTDTKSGVYYLQVLGKKVMFMDKVIIQ